MLCTALQSLSCRSAATRLCSSVLLLAALDPVLALEEVDPESGTALVEVYPVLALVEVDPVAALVEVAPVVALVEVDPNCAATLGQAASFQAGTFQGIFSRFALVVPLYI
jgi:hypothetical protein